MPGSFIGQTERKKQCGAKAKRQNREGDAVRKYSKRMVSLVKHLQGNVQPSEGVLISSVHRWAGTNYLSKS